jgi:hypothetical protein
MDNFWKTILWQQFGAAIKMLENAMEACPDEIWSDASKKPEWVENGVVGFWYLGYHTLFFLDFYLSENPEGFVPPSPFTLDELDPAGLLPDRPYTKAELQKYLDHCRKKCRERIGALTDETARQPSEFKRLDVTRAELFLYNMRHVQHHSAQMNLLLRQASIAPARWVVKANSGPDGN